jgi:CcmD family protein
MDCSGYLLAANIAVWLGLGGYVLFVSRKQVQVEHRLRTLQAMDEETGGVGHE